MIRFNPNEIGGSGKSSPSSKEPGAPVEYSEEDIENQLLKMDGFNDCILGLCHEFGRPAVIAYDLQKVLRKMMGEGMTESEAIEFFEFNQLGAWLGPMTPVFIDTAVTLEELEIED